MVESKRFSSLLIESINTSQLSRKFFKNLWSYAASPFYVCTSDIIGGYPISMKFKCGGRKKNRKAQAVHYTRENCKGDIHDIAQYTQRMNKKHIHIANSHINNTYTNRGCFILV